MTQRRVAILLPNLRGGGAECVAINLANSFAHRGYAVDIVLLSATGDFLTELRPDVRVVDLQVKRMRNLLFPLMRYLRSSRPSALLACMWPITVIAIWACKLARVDTRVVVAEHTAWSRAELCQSCFKYWQVKTSMHYTFPLVSGIVAVSQGAADDLARFANLNRSAITAIHNPVVGDPKPIAIVPLSPAGWWTGSHRRILAVGTLKLIKDYTNLLSAFALLPPSLDAKLLILGEGECRSELEQQARLLGIESRVFMPGFVKDTSAYYQHADLHVLSSTGEGFGNVIVEALEAGTPVVTTDCQSGPREILCDGKFGHLVPVGDAQALATAIAESLTTQHDFDALKVRAQDFSIDKAVDQYEAILFPDLKSKADV